MNRVAPGRCSRCGGDAYIQLAGDAGMLCAHCYGERKDQRKTIGRKGGERTKTGLASRRLS